MPLTFGSLFAGIGGFDLGFERAGMECKWQVEIDPFCQKVLSKHWPDVRRHDDVRTFPPDGVWNVDVIWAGFRARTFRRQVQGKVSMGRVQGCGQSSIASFAIFDRDTWRLKTPQCSLIEGFDEYCGTLPRSGLMRNGRLYRRQTLLCRTVENGCSLLPTPTRSMGQRGWGLSKSGRERYSPEICVNAFRFGYKPPISLLEWMMGFPERHTDLGGKPLETP